MRSSKCTCIFCTLLLYKYAVSVSRTRTCMHLTERYDMEVEGRGKENMRLGDLHQMSNTTALPTKDEDKERRQVNLNFTFPSVFSHGVEVMHGVRVQCSSRACCMWCKRRRMAMCSTRLLSWSRTFLFRVFLSFPSILRSFSSSIFFSFLLL